jgi:pyridoxamine 5'-phosphate oxidase
MYGADKRRSGAVNAEVDLADLRKNYTRGSLDEADLNPDPLEQFRVWLEEARSVPELPEPNAMILATVSASGQPSARAVLLKGLDERGFIFYTNFESRKAQELVANPKAALVFNWLALERQVRVEGEVSRLPRDESEAYHKTRPRSSQLGEWVSPQSQVIDNRAVLEARLAAFEEKFPGVVPLPDFWGGLVLWPRLLEFWQGRPSRLHDRFRYLREDKGWRLERLAP